MLLTEEERKLARHALGFARGRVESYRNYFVTDRAGTDGAIWMGMVEKGAATVQAGNAMTGGDDLFRLTYAGATAATDPGEKLHWEPLQPRGLAGKAGA